MSDQVKIAVVGASGRMGQAIIRVIAQTKGAVLSGALERDGAASLGKDAGLVAGIEAAGVAISADMETAFSGCDAIIDFTAPAATRQFAAYAADHGLVHIIGTTGMSAEDDAIVAEAAKKARIMKSGNMSMGVILLSVLVKRAAAALDAADWDIEVLEMHHKHKVDAPSGTALLLGQAAADGRDIPLQDNSVRVRDGHTGAREEGTVGFATLRGGSVVGDHSVIFAGEGERLTLSHHAEDRTIFARGAVKAALWAASQKPGLYSMYDVLGVS